MTVDWRALEDLARSMQLRAHAPYSRFQVGAALLTQSGTLFGGTNVENATYGLTVCAERVAALSMIAAGEHAPVALALVTRGPSHAFPCGACRQTLVEFASDMPVRTYVVDRTVAHREVRLTELLPHAFTPRDLA